MSSPNCIPLRSHTHTVTLSVLLLRITVICLSGSGQTQAAVPSPSPSPARTLVWGPGLKANVVLPARYFFIQAADSAGTNITSSPGETAFEVKITAPGEHFTRIWVQVLDRRDGSYLVRYRMYASYSSLHIDVLLNGAHVGRSPYVLNGPVYHEACICPQASADMWLKHMGCPASVPQIQEDLSYFPTVDPDHNAQEIPRRFGQRQSLCHYTIKDNQIYIKTHGEHVGFRIFMDAFLLSLTRKVNVPDVEFFVNLGDWPLEKRTPSEGLHPIFSWCGSNDTRDIVLPTYDLTESVLETMSRVSLDMMSVQANTGPPWGEKNTTAFWRGRDSRKERLDLVKLSRAHPDLVDAAFTNFFFFKHDESLYGPLVKHVSFFDFFKFKYQINVDGTVAAYRLPYLLAGGSVVLKQDSGYYEHFYRELRPWEHYIPFRRDLGDLLDKIRWAREHDEESRKIATAGQQFARTHLMGDDIFCYYFKLLQAYAALQISKPKVREGMERLQQPNEELFPCSCHRQRANDEL
uniref:Protein O-glucosyltransferase 2 n=1 Tax=Paramormyrops kingsleyae TaxID=1676925 RepID=A0A3B3SST4_9TELE|nr:KDEL motif-containing protein 1 [Paramormyrops kingsleyae]